MLQMIPRPSGQTDLPSGVRSPPIPLPASACSRPGAAKSPATRPSDRGPGVQRPAALERGERVSAEWCAALPHRPAASWRVGLGTNRTHIVTLFRRHSFVAPREVEPRVVGRGLQTRGHHDSPLEAPTMESVAGSSLRRATESIVHRAGGAVRGNRGPPAQH